MITRLHNLLFFFYVFFLLSLQLPAQTTQWRLIWDKNADQDTVIYYVVYRHLGSAPSGVDSIASVLHPADPAQDSVFYIDNNINKGVLYYYGVIAVDYLNRRSDFTNPVYEAIPAILNFPDTQRLPADTTLYLPVIVDDPGNTDSLVTWQVTKIPEDNQINVQLNANRAIVTTNLQWKDPHTLIFNVQDRIGFEDTDTLMLEVNPRPVVSDIPNQSIQKRQIFNSINLDNYVVDPDDALSDLQWSITGQQMLEIEQLNHQINISVTDTNWSGNETLIFRATDPSGLTDSDAATFTIRDISINISPMAINDTVRVVENMSIIIPILDNDYDSDGNLDPASVTVTTQPANGRVTSINSQNGAVTYVPDTDYVGNDSFRYTVQDNEGATSNIATVFITVENSINVPIAINDTVRVVENMSIIIPILDNDYDSDGNLVPSSVAVTTQPANGSVTSINSQNGAVTYVPDTDYVGNDSFRYTVQDNDGATSNIATVFINVENSINVPIAINDTVSMVQDTSIIIPVLNNDYDSDGNLVPASVRVVTEPVNGSVTSINSQTGAVTYVPDTGYVGNDSFRYTVQDNDGATSNNATVFIAIKELSIPSPDDVYVFPIPYISDEHDGIRFTNIPAKAKIIIYNLMGELVFEEDKTTPTYTWSVKNNSGKKIQSGVYIYYVQEGKNRKIASGKLVIVR